MKIYKGLIKELKKNQVFVFGTNKQGFHGGGAAGFASFNEGENWRNLNYNNLPTGWLGKWNVKGISEGFMIGREGMSYGIETIVRPGKLRSISPEEIKHSIKRLYDIANQQKDLEFLVAYTTKPNLNGYTPKEMASFFDSFKIPENMVFEENFSMYFKNNKSSNNIQLF